jgi:hypothetical protein
MATTHDRGACVFTGLCWFQGAYYFVTGMWPIVNMHSFKLVTGAKTDNLPTGLEADHWLVTTVSVLITAIAITLLASAWRKTQTLEIGVLAISGVIGLTIIDVVYTARRVILPMYLVDAVIEIPLILAWCDALLFHRGSNHGRQ